LSPSSWPPRKNSSILAWATEWYLRDEALTVASGRLVDHHHQLPLASSWGDGRLSSSGGQRFATSAKGPAVAALPRYFGHRRRGAQFFTWTSDQYSQYASKVVPATVRDAAHVLDGILDNQTELEIAEHTTDTHGYTEIVFGTFDLLGLRFAPRIRDLDRQRLYHRGPKPHSGDAVELLPHRIRPDLILNDWDAMLRLAASLKHGWAPASLLLTRLQASQRANPIARGLQEHGRLVKTNFILAWLADEQLRRRIGRQLNKGESLHAMRRYLWFAGEGRLRHRHADDQAVQAQCLTLVCNAIIVWNTVYAQAVLDQLRAEGQLITTNDLERLSPIQHAHIRPYRRYQFNTITQPGQLRPLRQPPPTRRASTRTMSPTASNA